MIVAWMSHPEMSTPESTSKATRDLRYFSRTMHPPNKATCDLRDSSHNPEEDLILS